MKDEKIIARVPRNANTEMVIKTGNYWNIDIIDMRWHENGKPTRKGIRMNYAEAVTVAKALNKIMRNKNGEQEENGNEYSLDEEEFEE